MTKTQVREALDSLKIKVMQMGVEPDMTAILKLIDDTRAELCAVKHHKAPQNGETDHPGTAISQPDSPLSQSDGKGAISGQSACQSPVEPVETKVVVK